MILLSRIKFVVAEQSLRIYPVVITGSLYYYGGLALVGESEVTFMLASFLGLFSRFGFSQFIQRESSDIRECDLLLSRTIIIVSLISLLSTTFLALPILWLYDLGSEKLPFFIFSYSLGIGLYYLLTARARVSGIYSDYAALNLLVVFFILAVFILTLLTTGATNEVKLGAVGAGYLLASVSYLFWSRKHFNPKIRDLRHFFSICKGASPVFINSCISWATSNLDKAIIFRLLGNEVVGLYTVIIQLVQIFKLSLDALLKTFLQGLFHGGVSSRSKYILTLSQCLAVFGIVAYLLGLVMPHLSIAADEVIFLVAGTVIYKAGLIFWFLVSNSLYGVGHGKISNLISFLFSCLYIIPIYVLVSIFGLKGVTFAQFTATSFLVVASLIAIKLYAEINDYSSTTKCMLAYLASFLCVCTYWWH